MYHFSRDFLFFFLFLLFCFYFLFLIFVSLFSIRGGKVRLQHLSFVFVYPRLRTEKNADLNNVVCQSFLLLIAAFQLTLPT